MSDEKPQKPIPDGDMSYEWDEPEHQMFGKSTLVLTDEVIDYLKQGHLLVVDDHEYTVHIRYSSGKSTE